MKRNGFCLLLTGVLLLAGCSLAQPEKEAADAYEDVFCGFYAVPYQAARAAGDAAESGETGEASLQAGLRDDFYNNPHLEVYGSERYVVEGIGNLNFDREVLFGVEDVTGHVTFPGMAKGCSLFLFTRTNPGENFRTTVIQSDMGPGEEGSKISATDEGDYMSASGVIYIGPPLGAGPDWAERDNGVVWTLYRVYQAQDGRLYLDGTGNSYGGAGGMTVNEHQTYRRAENGETVEETTVSVSVEIRQAERLERLTVYQYGADGMPLGADSIPPAEEMPAFRCAAGTAWVVVEELNADGTGKHTAYDLGEEGISHGVVLLDSQGYGTYTSLTITK